MEKFYEFLEKKINLPEFESWIYNSNELENRISEENYQILLEFNYKRPFAEIEIKDFIVTKIIGRKEFVSWKLDELLKSNEIEIPEKDLFLFAKQKPDFLKGKQFKFQSYQAEVCRTN